MTWCSPFDALMAASGPPAIFLRTPEGDWRLEADLTRDGWERLRRRTEPLTPKREPTHVLVRDRATGFVSWFYVTGVDLLLDHPRLDVRVCSSEEEAAALHGELGPTWVAEGI